MGNDPKSILAENLEAIFRNYPGFENLNKSKELPDVEGLGKADYTFFNRHYVVEQKDLLEFRLKIPAKQIDFHNNMLAKHGSDQLPGFYNLGQLTPEEADQADKLSHEMMRSFRRRLRQANDQLRDTKSRLGIPNATGLMLIISDCIPMLHPILLDNRIRHELWHPDNKLTDFSDLDGVIVLMRTDGYEIHDGRVFNFTISKSSFQAFLFGQFMLLDLHNRMRKDGRILGFGMPGALARLPVRFTRPARFDGGILT